MKKVFLTSAIITIMLFASIGLAVDCEDSDGGASYFTKGITKGNASYDTGSNNSYVNIADYCGYPTNEPENQFVIEFYCNAQGLVASEKYDCSYGCLGGACKLPSGNQSNETAVCTDSDGGKNYYTKGEVPHVDGYPANIDTCLKNGIISDTGPVLLEYFCVDGQTWGNIQYKCALGCSNGACRVVGLANETNETGISPATPQPFGIYATLGEKFKLQETQPVKIIDYLDANNNPLRIYLRGISKDAQAVKCEVFFDPSGSKDESQIITIPITQSVDIFGATIKFSSIDDKWEYATLQVVSSDTTVPTNEIILKLKGKITIPGTSKELYLSDIDNSGAVVIHIESEIGKMFPGESRTVNGIEVYTVNSSYEGGWASFKVKVEKAYVKAISTLETVKTNAPEQATGVITAQEKILAINTETDIFEEEVNQRGIGYRFKWFFGMVAEQEKQDAIFFKEQSSQLSETAELLLQVSEQIDEPAKSVLIEQATKLQEQSKEFLQKAEDKEKNAKGLFSRR